MTETTEPEPIFDAYETAWSDQNDIFEPWRLNEPGATYLHGGKNGRGDNFYARCRFHAITAFEGEISAALPRLRSFAFTFSDNPNRVDDLVQEALVRAFNANEVYLDPTNYQYNHMKG